MKKLLIAAVTLLLAATINATPVFAYPITVDLITGLFTDNNTGYVFLQMDRYMYQGGMKLSEYVESNNLHLATGDELAALFDDIGTEYENIVPAYDIGYTMSAGEAPNRPTWFMSHGYYDAGNGLFGEATFSTTLVYNIGELINANNSWNMWSIDHDPTQTEWSIGTWAVANHGTMPDPVPEPCTLFLVGAGLTGVAMFRKKFTNI